MSKSSASWLRLVAFTGVLPVVIALGASQLSAASAHSAVTSAPRGDQSWKDRAALLNQRIKDNPDARILFIGDSITQGWEGAGKEVWEKFYGDRKAVNIGIGGDRTQHVLYRLENGNLAGVKPRVAVVMIGTNNSNGEDNTPGQIAEGVAAIVNNLRSVVPDTKIILLAIFPRGENFNPQRGKLAQLNQVLQKLDDGEHVLFLDMGHRFLTGDGLLPADIMPDYLHLSPAGYTLWAEAMEPLLAKLLGESPKTAGAGDAGVNGKWIWKLMSPQGEVENAFELKAEGGKLTGRFSRDGSRWMEIENGKVVGDEMSFTLRRDRPGGGTMVYEMTGKLAAGAIEGTARTEMDGNPVSSSWSARRP